MTKIKRDGRYFALAEYNGQWYPFWDDSDIPEDIKKSMVKGKEYDIDKKVLFTNCGTGFRIGDSKSMTPCSGLWPNRSCGHCGGYGLGASFY